MKIMLNGQEEEVESATLLDLVHLNGWDPSKIVIEVNRKIIPASQFGDFKIQSGDCLEVVQFVGGG